MRKVRTLSVCLCVCLCLWGGDFFFFFFFNFDGKVRLAAPRLAPATYNSTLDLA